MPIKTTIFITKIVTLTKLNFVQDCNHIICITLRVECSSKSHNLGSWFPPPCYYTMQTDILYQDHIVRGVSKRIGQSPSLGLGLWSLMLWASSAIRSHIGCLFLSKFLVWSFYVWCVWGKELRGLFWWFCTSEFDIWHENWDQLPEDKENPLDTILHQSYFHFFGRFFIVNRFLILWH